MLDQTEPARIGPNALIQTDHALVARLGEPGAVALFRQSGVPRDDAAGMVPEEDVRALFDVLRAERPDDWAEIAADAGRRTADYILAHRIPTPVKTILKQLPFRYAAPLLGKAIARHAWTFAGSGRFSIATSDRLTLAIHDNPIALPGCPWHCAVFERLFGVLAGAGCTVTHDRCCARGDAQCLFTVLPKDHPWTP